MMVTNEQIKIENEQIKKIRDKFYKRKKKWNSNTCTVWNIIIEKAGDSFLNKNEEGMQQFFITKVVDKTLAISTISSYYSAYTKILNFLNDEVHTKVNCKNWDRQTILCHISRNEDSKADNSDNSSNEYIAVLENLLNSKFQEIKKHNQEIERNNKETKKLNQETKRLNQDSKERKQKVKEINKECLKITAIIDAVNKGQNIIRELPNITREFLSH